MNNNIDIGEIICESVDTIVTERLRTVNFDATITCTIVDDSQKEQGTYIVTDGSTRFTAYTTDTKLKNNQQVYVTIPNNDYSEQKMIIGKKTTDNANKPYMYIPPFNNFIKGSDNLAITSSDDYYGLTANSDYKADQNIEKQPVTIMTIPVTDVLPTTEIPFTRIGIKANFKTLLPSNTTQGNYGLRIVPKTNNNESEPAALDCNDFYGNPYQFFNYINQEQVFVIPPTWKQITEISLQFFQDNNFNLDQPEEIDEDLSWIEDSIGESMSNDNNIFVSGIELYLGYDVEDFKENKFQIYSIDNLYNYSNINGVRTEKTIKGEWVFIGEDHENSEIISADALPYDKETYIPLKRNILLSNGKYTNMYCWEKGKNSAGRMEYQGVRWYRQKYGAPKPDDYMSSGWEILDPADKENELYYFISPFELKVNLRTNNAEENYKCIVFDNLTFAQKELESKENIENVEIYENIEQVEKPLQISTSTSIVSNTITFVNDTYERTTSFNKQTQLAIVTTDDEDGNYYYYNLMGEIENENWSKVSRVLNLYYEATPLNKNSICKVEWIVPVLDTMFQSVNFKILGMSLDEINISDKKSWISVQNLNKQKNPVASNSSVYYKRIVIDNLEGKAKDLLETENPFDLSYQISQNYKQTRINNNIDCKLYYLNDEVPYTTSRRFSFGLNSTSGTEVVVQLQCNELEWENEENIIGYHPIIKLHQGHQVFKITPSIVISNSRQKLDINDFEIEYSWYGRTNVPSCFNSNSGVQEDNTYFIQIDNAPNSDEYIVLQMTMKYNNYSNLTAYLPFAFANKVNENSYAEMPDGVFEVIYDSASGLPFTDNYNIPYLIDNIDTNEIQWNTYIVDNNIYTNTKDIIERPYYPSINTNNSNALNTLLPSSFYTEGLKPVSIRAINKQTNYVYWSQPLLILKNKFPNSLINKWNENLLIDEENNTIMSAMMAAGTKDEENKFSGVLMGAIQGKSEGALAQHGLYGYQAGEQSFAFKEDGTAFIGKSGKGRIEFDGNKSTIKSSGYSFDQGIEIDLDDNYIVSKAYAPFSNDEEEILAFIKIMSLIKLREFDYIENDTYLSKYLDKFYTKCQLEGETERTIGNLEASINYKLLEQKAYKYIEELSNYYQTLETTEIKESNTIPNEPLSGMENKEKDIFSRALKDTYGLEMQVKINGQANEIDNKALTIGLVDNPSFQIDWEGNTTIVGGNFTIQNKNGETIFEVGKEGMVFNLLTDLSDRIDDYDKTLQDLGENLEQNQNNRVYTTPKGYSFSDEGLIVSSTGNLYTNITDDGMLIKEKDGPNDTDTSNDVVVLSATSDGVKTKNLQTSTFLIIGENSRFQNYEDPRTKKKRTGCFWIGG